MNPDKSITGSPKILSTNSFQHWWYISLLEWFLKQHATLKTEVIMPKIQLCITHS